MMTSTGRMILTAAMAGVLALATGPDALAFLDATLTSADFSMGYGADGIATTNFRTASSTRPWSDNENLANNSPTTQGAFTFSPQPLGGRSGGFGATFPNRTLTDGVDGDISAAVSSSVVPHFNIPIEASYNGAAPVDVVADDPNYRLMIEITRISIWAAAWPGFRTSMEWDEITAGHGATSPTVALIESNQSALASSYTQVAWDPADFGLPLGSVNATATRTFTITPDTVGSDFRYLDGLEIEGRVHLVYNAIPEPASLMVLGLGGLVLMRRR